MSESFYTYKCGHTAKYEYIKPDAQKLKALRWFMHMDFAPIPTGANRKKSGNGALRTA